MLHFIVITITITLFLQLQNINFVLNHTVHQLCTIVCAFDLECYSVSFAGVNTEKCVLKHYLKAQKISFNLPTTLRGFKTKIKQLESML